MFLTADNQIEEETATKPSKKDVGTEELSKENDDSVTEVYVSSVRDPDLFYVQKVGPSSVALDKLSQEMTAYFEQDFNKVNLVKVSLNRSKMLLKRTYDEVLCLCHRNLAENQPWLPMVVPD